MELFGGIIKCDMDHLPPKGPDMGDPTDWGVLNFNDFFASLVTLFLLTVNGWDDSLKVSVRACPTTVQNEKKRLGAPVVLPLLRNDALSVVGAVFAGAYQAHFRLQLRRILRVILHSYGYHHSQPTRGSRSRGIRSGRPAT